MKTCTSCGAQIYDVVAVCPHCGADNPKASSYSSKIKYDQTMVMLVKVFMILGCVSIGWLIIPLIWCIPMTMSVCKSMNEGESITTGMKVCSLLFVSLIAGIILLVMPEERVTVSKSGSKTNSMGNSSNVSVADELKKYKILLDQGVLTQDEFDEKKKQILARM